MGHGRVFLAHVPAGAQGELSTLPELEAALAELVARGRAAWPGIALDDEAFLAYVGERVPAEEAGRALRAVHAEDLWLACACARGDERALEAVDRRLAEVGPAVARLDGTGVTVDEVKQLLRQRLFVAEPGARPRIADYSGRGPLSAWLRVAAVRTALDLRRRDQKEAPADARDLDEVAHAADDPELDLIKSRYREEFREAFHGALSGLTSQERNVLRLHVLDGLNIDQIGAIYRVHRATVARWIARSRESLLVETRRRLREKLKLQSGEFESLMGLVQSQLDISLHRFLNKSGS